MCVCETVQSKENSRVFSLEFAHTAHRLRKAEIISWLIVFTSLLDGTYRRPLATPPHASSSSSSSHTHVNSHPHMHTRGRKHTLEAHIIADLSVLFLICLAEQTHAWVSHTHLRVTYFSLGMSMTPYLLRGHFSKRFIHLRWGLPRLCPKENSLEIFLNSTVLCTSLSRRHGLL